MKCILYLGLTVLSAFSTSQAQPQPSLEIDSAEMLIGDQRIISLSVVASEGSVDTVLLTPWNTIQYLEILGSSPWDSVMKGDETEFRKNYLITLFDTGYIHLPPLKVIIDNDGVFDTFPTNDLALVVRSVQLDSLGLAPIKYIIREPPRLSDYWIPILAIMLVSVGLAIWYFYRKHTTVPVKAELPVIPPHEVALQKLEELEQKKLWQQGQVKTYQSELTFIIREYLENRYGVPALEMTTGEIMLELKKTDIPPDEIKNLDEILNIADLVKFAKAEPELDIHQQFLLKAKMFVRNTTNFENED